MSNSLQCRTCATTCARELVAIFWPKDTYHEDVLQIRLELENRWKLPVKMFDNLPQHICNICIMEFKSYFEFRRRCMAAQERLLREQLPVKIHNKVKGLERGVSETVRQKLLQYNHELKAEDDIEIVFVEEEKDEDVCFVEAPLLEELVKAVCTEEDLQKTTPITPVTTPITPVTTPIKEVKVVKEAKPPEPKKSTGAARTTPNCLGAIDWKKEDAKRLSMVVDVVQAEENTLEDVPIEVDCPAPMDSDNYSLSSLDPGEEEPAPSKCPLPPKHTYCRYCSFPRDTDPSLYPSYNDEEYKAHVAEKHPDSTRPYNCYLCDSRFKMSSARSAHIRFHHQKEKSLCDQCGEVINAAKIQEHMYTYHSYGDYTCDICNREFKNISIKKLRYHKRQHDPNKKYKCKHCHRQFMELSHYQTHMRSWHKEGLYITCEICNDGKMFVDRYLWRMHQYRNHGGEKPIKCPNCPRRFATYSERKFHLVKVHNTTPIPFVRKSQKEIGETKHKSLCPTCLRPFNADKYVAKHLRMHTTEGRPFGCPDCNLHFMNLHSLKNHMISHHQAKKGVTHKCRYCFKEFIYRFEMMDHLMTHADDEDVKDFIFKGRALSTDNVECEKAVESITNYDEVPEEDNEVEI